MWTYNYTGYALYDDKNNLEHFGIKGMRWGYNYGKKNGKRIALVVNSLTGEVVKRIVPRIYSSQKVRELDKFYEISRRQQRSNREFDEMHRTYDVHDIKQFMNWEKLKKPGKPTERLYFGRTYKDSFDPSKTVFVVSNYYDVPVRGVKHEKLSIGKRLVNRVIRALNDLADNLRK